VSYDVSKPGRGVEAVSLFMQPRSIAVVGVSAKPGTAGRTVLANLRLNDFAGDIFIVGRAEGDIEGLPVLTSVDALPHGVDLAVFSLPASGVKPALEACAARGVRAVTIFSSGFAETGDTAAQDELVRIATEAGMALLGPNCLNSVTGLPIGFAAARRAARLPAEPDQPAIAMVSQSGGLMAYASATLASRNLPMAYTVSTGNEAGVGIPDFVDFFAQDRAVSVIALYLEEVRDPAAFLAAVGRARAAGKSIVAIHPGKGDSGRAAIQSHTGALAGDYATMQIHLDRAGVVLVDSLEEWVDVIELLARYPIPPTAGPGVLTFSGGFCAIAHDAFEAAGVAMPPLSEETRRDLAPQLPGYIPPKNPLDLGTQAIWQPELIPLGTSALMEDPAIGSVLVAINSGSAASQRSYGHRFIDAIKGRSRPAILAFPSPEMDANFEQSIRDNRLILSRSIERSIQALARITRHGRALKLAERANRYEPFTGLPELGEGAQPEWLGKKLLAAIGVATPQGRLVRTIEEAEDAAQSLGFPIAIKAQAAALAHKTEAGGVVLGIGNAAELRSAWSKLHDNVAAAQPDLALDGMLVERMAPKGLELVIGARRDPKWGAVLLVGLGGIFVEALGDVRLIPIDMAEEDIVAEIRKLRSARLFDGFRGSPPVDVRAVARTAALIGRLMQTAPDIEEIDLNPVFAHPDGQGVTAVDALVITKGRNKQ